ncbi:MAG: serine--tRNA ligase, partial [Candidatus Orphnella occulta]|nr:serine--tRNA ligase [Candidatus Orphnella occulta]
MLDIRFIRENPDKVKQALKNKNSKLDIDELLNLDIERRKLLVKADMLKNTRNIESNEIAMLKKQGKDATTKMNEMKAVSQKIKEIDIKVGDINRKISDI